MAEKLVIPEETINALGSARSVAVLTGAGVSAECGIKTFRGEGGIWEKYDFSKLATLEGFMESPELVWRWYEERREEVAEAEPNPAHLTLAEMERAYKDFTLITQNIDGLHEEAGSKNIIELHGNIWRTRCLEEGTLGVLRDVPLRESPPKCKCGSMLRPDIVWFGEALPEKALVKAFDAALRSDVFLSVGTSALVHPAASIPVYAKQSGAYLVEVNLEPTPLSQIADRSFFGKAGEVLPELWKAVRGMLG